jgi:hypothetical protein
MAGYARFAKEAGEWLFEMAGSFRTPGVETNDLAFSTLADYVWMNANVFRVFNRPSRWYRRLNLIAGATGPSAGF